jgi:hypothetical protein
VGEHKTGGIWKYPMVNEMKHALIIRSKKIGIFKLALDLRFKRHSFLVVF